MRTAAESNRWAWLVIALSLLALAALKVQQRARGGIYPDRPVTLICPFSPGGGTDLLCRMLAHEAEKRLGQPVLVNNITGGGGAIGHASAQLAAPDGYTLLATTFELVSLPVRGLVPFTHEDLDLLLMMNMDPGSVAVRADFPANTLAEFVARGRLGPPLRIGNSGTGAVWHLAAALLARETQIEAIHVPFNGASPAITALIGGHIDAVTVSPAELKTYVESGQLKLLAAMSENRLPGFPGVPTCREQGSNVIFGTWRGLALPRGVPPHIRERIRDVAIEVIESDAFRAFAAQSGMNLRPMDAPEFRAMVTRQSAEVAALMKYLGLAR